MGKLGVSGRNPSEEEWKRAVKAYNGSGDDADRYLDQVWKRFNSYNEQSYKKKFPPRIE